MAHQWTVAQECDLNLLPTRLQPRQVREAEVAVGMLAHLGLGLVEGAAWLVRHYSPPLQKVEWTEAIRLYEEHRLKAGVSVPQVSNVAKSAKRLARRCKGKAIDEVGRDDIEGFMEAAFKGPVSAVTYNQLLRDLRTFLRWCVRARICSADPSDGLELRRVVRGLPEVVTPERVGALLHELERGNPGWIPYFSMTVFAAVRPGTREGEAYRIDRAIRDGEQVFREGGLAVRGKANGWRVIPWHLTGPLRAWLEAYPPVAGLWPVSTPERAEREITKFRQRFGFGPNVLRHTGLSTMAYAPGSSLAEVALAGGTSEQMLRRHYLGLWSREMTTRLWAVTPSVSPGSR